MTFAFLDAERLASCFGVANLGNWTWDAATCFVTFSDRAAESSGFLRSGSGAHGSESSRALANSPVSWCQLASEKLGGFSLRQYTVA